MPQWIPRLLAVIVLVGATVMSVGTAAQADSTQHEIALQVSMPGAGAGIAVDPDRGLVYIAARFNGVVYVYDEATLTLQNTIPVPNEPYNIAVGPTGAVYVSQYTGNNLPGTLSTIDPTTNAVVSTVAVGKSPVGVTVSHDGTRLFVGNASSAFVSVLDLTNPLVPDPTADFTLPSRSEIITESADGNTLFVSTNGNNVYRLDAHTGQVTSTWSGMSNTHQVAPSTDGSTAFVSQQLGGAMPIFTLATNTQTASIPLLNTYYQSTDLALNTGYITQPFTGGGTVTIIDAASGSIIQSLTGIPTAYYTATDTRTHSTFVTSLTTSTLTKIAAPSPIVVTDPQSQSIQLGETASFSASATGANPITVQWQKSADGGGTWSDIAAATETTYVTPPADLTDDGNLFRAVFVDANSSNATTATATLTVTLTPVTIVQSPASITVQVGSNANFNASATGTGPIDVQWQTRVNTDAPWKNIPLATETNFTLSGTRFSETGTQVRAVFSGPGAGNSATTDPAELTVIGSTITPSPDPSPRPEENGNRLSKTGALTIHVLAPALAITGLGAILLIHSHRRRRTQNR